MKLRSTLLFAAASLAAPALLPVAAVPAFAANTLTTQTTKITESTELSDYAGTYSGNIFELAAISTQGFHKSTFNVYSTDADGNLSSKTSTNTAGDASVSLTNGSTTSGSQTLWYYFVGTGATVNMSGTYGHTLYVSSDLLSFDNVSTTMGFGPIGLGGLIVGASDNSFTTGRTTSAVQLTANSSSGLNMNIGADTTLQGSAIAVNTSGTWTVASGKTLTLSGATTIADNVNIAVSGGGALAVTGNLTLASGTGTITYNGSLANSNMTYSDLSAITTTGNSSLSVSGLMKVASGFTGTVELKNFSSTVSLASLSDYWTSGSTLKLDSVSSAYLSGATLAANLEIGSGGLTINNGSSGSGSSAGIFSGKLTGAGTITFNKWNNAASSQLGGYKFTGDLTDFTGNIVYTQANGLSFGAATAAEYASTATATDGKISNIAGTGSIRVSTSAALTFNYAVSDNVLALGNSSISASSSTVTFGGGATYLLDLGSTTYAANTTTVSAGTLRVQADSNATFSSTIGIAGGATFEKTGAGTLSYSGDWGTTSTTTTDDAGVSATTNGTVKISAGTFSWNNNSANRAPTFNLEIAEGATFTNIAAWKNHTTLSGTLSGAGTLIAYAPTTTDQGDGYRKFTLTGDASGFTGEWQLETASSSAAGNRRVLGVLGTAESSETYVFGGVVNFTNNNADATKASSGLSLLQNTKIGGLTGTLGTVYGYLAAGDDGISVENTGSASHSLEINLKDGADYDFAGTFDASVSALTISGAGTQTLSGASTGFTGTVTVSDSATLGIGNASALGTGDLTVSGTLDLGVANTASAALSLLSSTGTSGTLTLDNGGKILVDLGDYTAGTYKLIGASDINASGFSVGESGNVLFTETLGGRVTTSFSVTDNVLSLTLALDKATLTWNGGSDGVWKIGSGSDTGWTNTSSSSETFFNNYDTVTFPGGNGLATVKFGDDEILRTESMTVSGATTFENDTGHAVEILPGFLTVNANATFTGTNADSALTLSVAQSNLTISNGNVLTLGDNGTLDLGSGSGGISLGRIAGTGTVAFVNSNTSNHNDITMNVGSDFNGTFALTGNFNWNDATLGENATICLSNANYSDASMWSNVAGTLSWNFEFETDYKILSTYASLTVNGAVSAEGKTLTLNGGNGLTLGGGGTIGTVSLSSGTAKIRFSKAEDSESETYTVGTISTMDTATGNKAVTIDSGVTVNASSLLNNWGLTTLTVEGTLNLSNLLRYSTGGGTNTITGSGTINAEQLLLGNAGTYVFTGGVTLNLGASGITKNTGADWGWGLQLDDMTLGSTDESWSAVGSGMTFTLTDAENGGTKINAAENTTITFASGVVFAGEGKLVKRGAGTLVMEGANTYSGGTEIESGTVSITAAENLGTGAVSIGEAGTLEWRTSEDLTLTENKYSGAGTLAIAGTGSTSVAFGETGFTGSFNLRDVSFSLNALNEGASYKDLQVAENASFTTTADTAFTGTVEVEGTLGGAGTDTRISVAEGAFSGTLSNATLVKTGAGTLDAAGMTYGADALLSVESGTVSNLTLSESMKLEINTENAAEGATVTLTGLVFDGGTLALSSQLKADAAYVSLTQFAVGETSASLVLDLAATGVEVYSTVAVFAFDTDSKSAWERIFGTLSDEGTFGGNLDVQFSGGYTFSWSEDGNTLLLTKTSSAGTLTWTGGNGSWNATDANWNTNETFTPYSEVSFETQSMAGASEIAVEITESVSANTMQIDIGAGNTLTLTGGEDILLRVTGGIDLASGTLKWNLSEFKTNKQGYGGTFSIAEGATLDVVYASDSEMSNTLSGEGSLHYAVDGATLTLSGKRSDFAGTLEVGAGTVVLGGTATETEAFSSIVISENGAVQVSGAAHEDGYKAKTLDQVSGTGTLVYLGDGENGDKCEGLYLSSDFSGTVELKNVNLAACDMRLGDGSHPLTGSTFANASKIVLNNAALNFTNGVDEGGSHFEHAIEIADGATGTIRAYAYNTIVDADRNRGVYFSGNVYGGEGTTLKITDSGDVVFQSENNTLEIGALTVEDMPRIFTLDYVSADIRGNFTSTATKMTLGGTVTVGGNFERTEKAGGDGRETILNDGATVSVAGNATLGNNEVLTLGNNASFDVTGTMTNFWGLTVNLGDGAVLSAGTFQNTRDYASPERPAAFSGAGADSSTVKFDGIESSPYAVTTFKDVRVEIGDAGITGGGGNNRLESEGATFAVLSGSGWSSDTALVLNAGSAVDEDGNALVSATTFEVDAEKTITLSGAVSGDGALVKTGAGTLTLTQVNTNAGGTAVSAGTLEYSFAGDTSFGTAETAIDVGAAGTLAFSGSGTTTLGAGTELNFEDGAVLLVDEGRTLSVASGATLNGNIILQSGGESTKSRGTLSFASSTEMAGSLTLSGGKVSVEDGATLTVAELNFEDGGNAAVTGDGLLLLNGAVSTDRATYGITVDRVGFAGDTTANVADGATLTVESNQSTSNLGAGTTLTKTGAGSLVFDGSVLENYAGSIVVETGKLESGATLGGFASLSVSGLTSTFSGEINRSGAATVSVSDGAKLNGNVSLSGGASTRFSLTDNATVGGNVTFAGTSADEEGRISAEFGTATLSGNLNVSNAALTFSGTLSGVQTLIWGEGNTVSLSDVFRKSISDSATLIDFSAQTGLASADLGDDVFSDAGANGRRQLHLVYNAANTSLDITATGALVWNSDVTLWESNNQANAKWDFTETDGSAAKTYFQNNDYVEFRDGGSLAIKADEVISTSGIVFDIGANNRFTLSANGDNGATLTDAAGTNNAGLTVLSGAVTLSSGVHNTLTGGVYVYGGSLSVSGGAGSTETFVANNVLGTGKVVLGDMSSPLTSAALTMTFAADVGEPIKNTTVDNQFYIGNTYATITVGNSGTVLLSKAILRDSQTTTDDDGNETTVYATTGLTKAGAGTLNILRNSRLDSLTVSAGTVILSGSANDLTLDVKNVSIENGAKLTLEHGGVMGTNSRFEGITLNGGSLTVGDGAFDAATISSSGNSAITGNLCLATGTILSVNGTLSFTGEIAGLAGAVLTMNGTGTLNLTPNEADSRFSLGAAFSQGGGIVNFTNGVTATAKYSVAAGADATINIGDASNLSGVSTFESGLDFGENSTTKIAFTHTSSGGEFRGLTVNGDVVAGAGSSVTFAGADNSGYYVRLFSGVSFGGLVIGGRSDGNGAVHLLAYSNTFSAGGVYIGAGSSLILRGQGASGATAEAIIVEADDSRVATLDLYDTTLTLSNEKGMSVLDGAGTLLVKGGTLSVSGQNYSATGPKIELEDATFNFNVTEAFDEDGSEVVIAANLSAISTADGASGTVSKTGAGTLWLRDTTAFDGEISLEEGTTMFDTTAMNAAVSIDAGATMAFYGVSDAGDLAKSVSGKGTLAVAGTLSTDDMTTFEGFDGKISASGNTGTVYASGALADWLDNGTTGTSRTLAVADGGYIAYYDTETAITLSGVSLESGTGTLYGAGTSLTVEKVAAVAGTELDLRGAGTLGSLAFAEENDANTLALQRGAEWTLNDAGSNIAHADVFAGATLTVADAGALADASVYVDESATLAFAADGTYANDIGIDGTSGSTVSAAAGTTIALTGEFSEADSDASKLILKAEADATLTVNDSVLSNLPNSELELNAAAGAKIAIDVSAASALSGDSATLSGAGTAEFAVATDATLTLSGDLGEIGAIVASGAGTVSVSSDTAIAVAAGGAGTLSVGADATAEIGSANLSGFTLTGKGATTLSGASLGGISDAENVKIDAGTTTVKGDISGSAIAFASASAKLAVASSDAVSVTGTTLSGATVTLANSGSGAVNYASDSRFSEETTTLVLEAGYGISGGVVNAAFSGSLTKSGDGTWTVSDYTLGDSAGQKLTVNDAGTLIWQGVKFGDSASEAEIAIASGATLQLRGLAGTEDRFSGEIGGSGTLQVYGTGTEAAPLTLDVTATAGSEWRLRVSGGSQVKVLSALPGSLLIEGAGTVADLVLSSDAEMTHQLLVGQRATLKKTGDGTLTLGNSEPRHQVSGGTVSVEAGTLVQAADATWTSDSSLEVAEAGTFTVLLDAATSALRNGSSISGTGTLNFTGTGADGYELSGALGDFAGTANIASDAKVTLTGSLFGSDATIEVADGGELKIAISSKSTDARTLTNLSGAGTLIIDTPFDSYIYTAVYDYDADNAFAGTIDVRSGVLSVKAGDALGLAATSVLVGRNTSTDGIYGKKAVYGETSKGAGIVHGAFLRIDTGSGVYDATRLLSASGDKYAFSDNSGVIFAGGNYSVGGNFGSGGLFVTERGATLAVSGTAQIDADVFVASGSTLTVNAPAATASASAGTSVARLLSADDARSSASKNAAISGDFTLNGTLKLYVADSTDLDSALLDVGGDSVINTHNGTGANRAKIEIYGDVSAESLAGTVVLGGKNAQDGDLDSIVSVENAQGEKLTVTRDRDGQLVIGGGSDSYNAPSGLSGLYAAIASDPTSPLWNDYLKNDLANADLTTERLVKLSPVSFGALVEMQSGFAAIENDLLRERLEQRRYERAFASDGRTQFKPFVNVVGSTREGDGDGSESSNYDITHAGVLGGFDVAVSSNTIFGVSLGLDWAKADLNDGAGKHEGDGVRFGVYGMSVFGNAYFGYGVSAGATSFDTKRHSGYEGETLRGDTDGNDVNASLLFGAGWTLSEAAGIDFAPYVGLDLGYAHVKSFSETGVGETALDVDGIERWSLRGKIGASLNWRATDFLRIGVEAAFTHEFLDSDIDIDAEFSSGALAGTAFSSTAYLMDENTIQVGPRIDFRIDDTWSVSAAYTFETDLDDTTAHTANIGVRARF